MSAVTFPTSLGGDGQTYSDDTDPTTGLDGGGWRIRYVPSLAQALAMAQSARDSAASAILVPGTNATSTTSIAIVSSGTVTPILTQPDKLFIPGQFVTMADTAAPTANYMVGQVSAFDPVTEALSINVLSSSGSGTKSAWTISLSAKPAVVNDNVGDVKLSATAPASGWLPCEGAVYTKASYAALATLLGSIPGDYTWTARTVTGVTSPSFVGYSAGLYVAAGDAAGNVSTSPDAITWTSRTGNLGANSPSDYAYFNSLHIVTANGGMLSTSPTGVTWTARTANCGVNGISLCAGTSRLVAYKGGGTTTASSSPDGTAFTSRTLPVSISSMAFGNGVFVAIGNGGALCTSPDGDTWTSRTSPISGSNSSLVFFNGYFYYFSFVSPYTVAARSTDGITWTPHSARGLPILSGAPYFRVNANYVQFGVNGLIYRTTDMLTFEVQNASMTMALPFQSYYPSLVVNGLAVTIVGSSLYTSPEYDFNTSTQFRTPDLRSAVPPALQGKAKFYMKAA